MAKSLVIVESPAKANTIKKFLGKDFLVMASMGHVRALPSKPGSVDIENDFEPQYQVLPQRKKDISQIKKAIKSCESIYLATDLDREGEAIAWHLLDILGLNNGNALKKEGNSPLLSVKRITFYEITRDAVQNAIKNPRDVIQYLVNAQQARVILDYLFGFNLSPFLWKKVRNGLSAGRVQSVALRLICDREEEIEKFKPKEYWTISSKLSTEKKPVQATILKATLVEIDGNKLKKFSINNEENAKWIVKELKGAKYTVIEIKEKEAFKTPSPPFTTSTLQQEAFKKLGFSAKKTMSIAQKLYEGIEIQGESVGLITYMRTDSVNLSKNALAQAKKIISKMFGDQYTLKAPRYFKNKAKNIQEAHEAIRPTDLGSTPEDLKAFLTPEQSKLYTLIWRRIIACQMAKAKQKTVTVDIAAKETYIFRASGSIIEFPGFMKVYHESKDDSTKDKEDILPSLSKGQNLYLIELLPNQHFTVPPHRYTEASLIKILEEYGIGRPSTYATIMSTLQARGYVNIIDRHLHPEDIGMTVNKLLVNHFFKYVDYEFTAKMEGDLDQIAKGEIDWRPVIHQFWFPFYQLIKEKDIELKKSDIVDEETDEKCPQCNNDLIIKLGRYGKFYACKGYPKCRFVRALKEREEELYTGSEVCEMCGKKMIIKAGRYGKFLACEGYPECKNTKGILKDKNGEPQFKEKVTNEVCEKCGGNFVIKGTRYGGRFLSCQNYPKCKNAKPLSTGVKCPRPDCNGDVVERNSKKGRHFFGCSNYPDCNFIVWNRPIAEKCPNCGGLFLLEKVSKNKKKLVECFNKECKYSQEREAE
ncbi:MAG: type I DNA topoisomerase [Thermodesulfobacteriota bacterium]|nr:type I DNA topoisomerase [Thermodesulfobacteriota bacterium]